MPRHWLIVFAECFAPTLDQHGDQNGGSESIILMPCESPRPILKGRNMGSDTAKRKNRGQSSGLAGRGGFEPPVEFKARQSLSRRSRSATPAPPQRCFCSADRVFQAEGEGFEPTVSYPTPVFKTGALSHSAIPPDFANFAFIIVSYINRPDKHFPSGRGDCAIYHTFATIRPQ